MGNAGMKYKPAFLKGVMPVPDNAAIVGYLMLMIVFGGIFGGIIKISGVRMGLLIIGSSIFVIAFVIYACFLIVA